MTSTRFAWWRLGAGAGVLGAGSATGLLCRPAGVVVVAVDLLVPAAFAVILLGTALFGSDRMSERAFRLTRCLTGHREPEPPRPAAPPTVASAGYSNRSHR
jgi:hypothetical protein